MAKDKKVQMPSTGAGLVRYFDEYKNEINIKPEYVIYISVAVIVIEILIKKFFII